MKKLTCTICFALSAFQLASAVDAPKEEKKDGEEATAPAVEESFVIETKNKSSFALEESGRNPFWPIGWKPSVKKPVGDTQVGPEISETAFLVSSIILDRDPSRRFAIINGKVMNEGQVFGLQLGNQTYQLTVKAIQDGQVILARRDQEIAVPLRRK